MTLEEPQPQDQNATQPQQQNDAAPVEYLDGPSAITTLESSDELIRNFELSLRGLEKSFDKKTNTYVLKPARKPIMNEKGIATVINTLQSVAHHNTTLSNLTKDRIYTILHSKSRELAKSLFVNQHEFEISDEDVSQMPLLIVNCLQIMEMSMRRAWEGREQNLVFSRQSSNFQKIEQAENRPRSFFDSLPLIGRR